MTQVRIIESADLAPDVLESLRDLCDEAFGERFDDSDWEHAVGGRHVVAFSGREVMAHAAVVPRELWIDGVLHQALYVEAVATDPSLQGQGIGTQVMEAVEELIESDGLLAALSSGSPQFYERLGWERWQGPTYVQRSDDLVRTPDEDDTVLVLRPTPTLKALDLTAPIACRDRSGDAW